MFKNWLKKFLGIGIIEEEIDILDARISEMYSDVEKEDVPEITLLRHQLGSIDLIDVEEKEMIKEERIEFLSSVAVFYPTVIKKEIKKMVYEQTQWMAKESENEKQFTFGRGTINGLMLLLERYEKYQQEYQALTEPPELIDRTKLFPEQ